MKYKNILTKKFLYQKYIVEKLSINKTAKIIGCNPYIIWWYLRKYNIHRRSISDANKERFKNPANHPMYGKHQSESAKKKISEFQRGRKRSEGFRKNLSVKRKGKNNPAWRGGKTKTTWGYILIKKPDHPYANNHNYVPEHRLKVEEALGRYLTPKEVVHHIDGNKQNNDISNLMVFCCNSAHHRFHNNPDNVKPEEIIFDGRDLKLKGE